MSQMGHYFILFSIRCRTSNVNVSLFFLSITKSNQLTYANTCKGKVPVDQLYFLNEDENLAQIANLRALELYLKNIQGVRF